MYFHICVTYVTGLTPVFTVYCISSYIFAQLTEILSVTQSDRVSAGTGGVDMTLNTGE